MVRAPCCEKMGLKRGPWTPEEDQILVAYIQRYGHGNWRALPKLAGLLRCGKSCRLRWTNYLRPDIKRGNFSKEEEETIIKLHEMLGNRWSAIAGRLPGRTDNEIKNVWHTHLKKRLKSKQTVQDSKRKSQCEAKMEIGSKPITLQLNPIAGQPIFENSGSPACSYTDVSCSSTESSVLTGENYNAGVTEEMMYSSEEFPELDDSFWSEALSIDNSIALMDATKIESPPSIAAISEPFSSLDSSNDDMNFWLRIFMEAGDSQELPEI